MKFNIIYTFLVLVLLQVPLCAQTNVPFIDFSNYLAPNPSIDQITISIIGAIDTSLLKFTSTPSQVEKLNYQNGRTILNESYNINEFGLYGKFSFDSIYYKNNLISKIVHYERTMKMSDTYIIKHIIVPEYDGNTLKKEQYYDKNLNPIKNVVYKDYTSNSHLQKYSSIESETKNNFSSLVSRNTYENHKINNVWRTKYSLSTNQYGDTLSFTKLDTIFKNQNCDVSFHKNQVGSLNICFLNEDSTQNLRHVEIFSNNDKYYQYIIYQYFDFKNTTKKENELLMDFFVAKGPWVNYDENFVVEFRKVGDKYTPKARILNRSKTVNGLIADFVMLNKGNNELFVNNGEIFSNVELGKIKFSMENILGDYILVLEPIEFQNSSLRLKSFSNQLNNLSKYDNSSVREYAKDKIISKPKINKNIREAMFPGGDSNFNSFIRKNLVYPAKAKELGMERTLDVEIIINEDGTVKRIAKQTMVPYFDEEVDRLIKLMPKWTPAMENGKPIKSILKFPVKFQFN